MDPCSSEGHGYTERRSSRRFRRVSARNFAVNKTAHRFSAIDQGHEHSNAAMKDGEGAVGLTENIAALKALDQPFHVNHVLSASINNITFTCFFFAFI